MAEVHAGVQFFGFDSDPPQATAYRLPSNPFRRHGLIISRGVVAPQMPFLAALAPSTAFFLPTPQNVSRAILRGFGLFLPTVAGHAGLSWESINGA